MTPARALQPNDFGRDDELDESLVTFVEEHYPGLLRFLERLCFDAYLAEEALQEALIVAINKWPVVSKYDQPVFWVRKTARNKLRRLRANVAKEDLVSLAAVEHGLEEPKSAYEAEMVVRQALRQLPEQKRAVLALMMEGDRDEMIAEQLGLALTTVRTYKHEIRKKCQELFESKGDMA